MVATVSPWADQSIAQTGSSRASDSEHPTPATSAAASPGSRRRAGFIWAAGAALCVVLVVFIAFQFRGKVANPNQSASPSIAPPPQNSIAVLPFLDLTEGMKEEEFADGMTEELIDRLSKVPGFLVPAPKSSFYFKGKQIPIADIARTLGVSYVLDGSVRKSGARLRVAARLIRADNGYVVWTETYDRPLGDILMVQDDIAGEVTKALKASIAGCGKTRLEELAQGDPHAHLQFPEIATILHGRRGEAFLRPTRQQLPPHLRRLGRFHETPSRGSRGDP